MDQFIRDNSFKEFATKFLDSANNFNRFGNDYLKVCQQNVRSISKNFEKLEVFLNQFKEPFDCIILTETWKIQNKHFFDLDGYESVYNQGTINQNDGVIVYIRNSRKYKTNIVKLGPCKLIEVLIDMGECIKIACTYRPPSTNEKDFVLELQNYLGQQRYNEHYFAILGDININLFSDKNLINDYLVILSEFNFTSTINISTRTQDESSTCIDHIFVRAQDGDL